MLVLEMPVEVSRHSLGSVSRMPPRWMARVTDFLHDRYQEHISLGEIASTVGVHPVHLARQFRRYEGCTIGEYIRRLRIELACRKLRVSNESLSAIAAGVGFADQSHFSRIFKNIVGITPAQYRASLRLHS
jgi:AraC family transcriptional regulator